MVIVNGFQPLTIITKRSILDVAAVLDPPLSAVCHQSLNYYYLTIFEDFNFLCHENKKCYSELKKAPL